MRRSTARSTVTAALAALALLVAGCAAPAPAPTPTATAAVEIPDTPVGEVVAWALEEMNAEEESDPADWAPRLDESFTAQVSADDVAEIINRQIRPARPLVATAYEGDDSTAVATVAGELGDPFDLTVAINAEGLITTFVLAPTAPPRTPAESLGEVEEPLR